MRLFPPHLSHANWQTFPAYGYSNPVTGVVYRGVPRPTCGIPLGGLDTGCLDIEPNGMLGYCTIFNHLVEPRLLLNMPFLGLSVDGSTWVLVSDRKAKLESPIPNPGAVTFPPIDYTPRYTDLPLDGVEIADSIDYWGHYPVLDMEFNTSAPVEVDMRLWSPFIPGDEGVSMTPGALFELHLRNREAQPQQGTFAFSFPGFELAPETDSSQRLRRTTLSGELNGVHVESGSQGDAWESAYILAALDGVDVRTGGALNADSSAWRRMAESLPPVQPGETGASLTVDFDLEPDEERVIHFLLTWHAPHWRAGGSPAHVQTNLYTHRYPLYYPDAVHSALFLARQRRRLLPRVIAWQEVLYQDEDLPGWLADSLINVLHLIPETSIWAQAQEPIGSWCDADLGLFALNECPRGCPQMECLPCSFYGNLPLVYFFPRAALSTLHAYKAYQFADGRPPWIFGGVTAINPINGAPYDLTRPDKGYQTVLNGASYIIMADRYWRVSGDQAFLVEFWDSLKRCNDFSLNLRPSYGLSQVVAMPTPGTDGQHGLGDTEWFEAPEPGWKGYVTHAGGVRMAQVSVMRRMASAMGDEDYARKCELWLEAGTQALEKHLWSGEYYLNFNQPETGEKSELLFGYQLDGQWIADWHGLPGVFPEERVRQALDKIRQVNCRLSQSGAVNYANASAGPSGEGAPVKVGGYGTYSYFPPELYMLAMTYMYAGEREFGLQLLHKCLQNIVHWGYLWDMLNTVRGDADTGERAFGADYYQNMMLWGVPAALTNADLTDPLRQEGLVSRVMRAGRGE